MTRTRATKQASRQAGRWPQPSHHRRSGAVVGSVAVGLLALSLATAPPAAAYPRPGSTEQITAGDGLSGQPAISGDGRYIAFWSAASSLVPEDTNGPGFAGADVFVHDRQTGTTERVSVASDGTEANDRSNRGPEISGDGRYVAFWSQASNLVPGDTNGPGIAGGDVFVHDRQTGTTERVSVASDGTQSNGDSELPEISGDGRYVAFWSQASNLVPEDTNDAADIFVHDRQADTTERVSVASDGTEANDHGIRALSFSPSLSADGRYVAFKSEASNLVPDDTNDAPDVFVHDRQTGATERVSGASDGTEANGTQSGSPTISGDGRYVAFWSLASNLVPGDSNATGDVFVHDRQHGTTERVSVASDGTEANDISGQPTISADGRHVAFHSRASNLYPDAPDDRRFDSFVHDRQHGTTELVSVALGSEATTRLEGEASDPHISAEGRHVAFHSPGGGTQVEVFVRDRGPATGIGALDARAAPGAIDVSGWARFSGATVSTADDPDDDGTPGAAEAGAELTGAELVYRVEEEDLLVRLNLASLPQPRQTSLPGQPPGILPGILRDIYESHIHETGGGAAGTIAPGVLHQRTVYAVGFELDGIRYEVRARSGSTVGVGSSTPLTVAEDPPHFALYRCDPNCTEQANLGGGVGTTGDEVLMSVPLSALDAAEGMALTRIAAYTSREEDPLEGEEAEERLDEVDLPDGLIPVSKVELGVATPSASQAEVPFSTQANLVEGRFSGTVDVSTLPPGPHRVWARACVGDTCRTHAAEIASEITVSAEGRREQGLHKADLSWNSGSDADIDVYRDRALITTVPNSGFYTDHIDRRGQASYIYQVCETGTTICSTEATVRFGGPPTSR